MSHLLDSAWFYYQIGAPWINPKLPDIILKAILYYPVIRYVGGHIYRLVSPAEALRQQEMSNEDMAAYDERFGDLLGKKD